MAIIYEKPESLEDFANTLMNVIKFFDTQIFETPLPVTIKRSRAYENRGSAALEMKKWFFKLLGFKDEYSVYAKSKHMEHSLNVEFSAYCYGVHEVRHRFQLKNPSCILSPGFIKANPKYFDLAMYFHVFNGNFESYGHNEYLFKREFDANILDTVINENCSQKNMSNDLVLELIQSNEKNIISLLQKLY